MLLFGLFVFAARLANGVLVFADHDVESYTLIKRVLAENAGKCGLIHMNEVIKSVLSVMFLPEYGLPELVSEYLRRSRFYFLSYIMCWFFFYN